MIRAGVLGLASYLLLAACAVPIDDDVFWVPDRLTIDDRAEGETGLFMGQALSEPMERTLSHREWMTTKIEFRLTPDKFIPATQKQLSLDFGRGRLNVLHVEREAATSAPLFVHCYGIGANLYNNGVQHALKLLPYGDMVTFDLPGHGESGGTPTVADFEQAALAMAAYIETLMAKDEDRPVIFWGHSLGGFVCAQLAQIVEGGDGLVLEAAGQNAKAVAQTWIPFALRPFVRVKPTEDIARFDIVDILAGYDEPVLILGAKKDKVIREHLVRHLAETLEDNGLDVTYEAFREADHSTIAFADEFDRTVHLFLADMPTAP